MSTITVSDINLDSPAQRLRRQAAAARVHFTWWGVRRTLSREQKEEAAHNFGAEGGFLSAGKRLLNTKHAAWRKLTALKGQIQNYWRGVTLPYTEPGVRLIRQNDIEAFVHKLEGFREELREAERDLNTVFEEIKQDARLRLGRLYNDDDYPPMVAGLFNVDWEFPSIEPPNYLMRLSPEIYQQEQQRIAARFEEAVRLAEEAFASELSQMVNHLVERLTPTADGERKVFRDSALTNLTDFFGRFRLLNINSNPELDVLVTQAEDLVLNLRPGEVRTMPGVRAELRQSMATVAQQLDSLMVTAPRRRIIRPSVEGAA